MREDLVNCCYVNHLVAEHRRVHAMLKQVRAEIVRSVQPDNRPTFEGTGAILRRLREELAAHFREEQWSRIAAFMLARYLLHKPGSEEQGEMITLTPSQYQHLVARLPSLAPVQLET